MKTKCKICSKIVKGRSDKKFCSSRCKNYYHVNLRKVTTKATAAIDEMLHRNRSILLECLGKSTFQKKIKRTVLEKKNFKFQYHTHSLKNKQGKRYYWVYDFGWMPFSDDYVLVVQQR
ncbi:hypothetical protein SCB49_14615 [unidentified eubacterium SCB49]|nr:hypothetical protein SCB49_14615 [unidentified eubacterium SCB49]